jgi:hypothetical protein
MDLFKIIQDLYEEKKRIDRVIGALEELATGKAAAAALEAAPSVPPKKRRGRPRKQPPSATS